MRWQQRLASPDLNEQVKNYAEWMLPQMYAAKWPDGSYNPFGASNVYETYSPDWYGRWADVKHLNHGGHAGQRIWEPRTEQNWRVLHYLGRVMRWAVLDLGFDGFRIDHTLGMPYPFFEQILPWVEMEARRAGRQSIVLVHEDHDRKDYSARVGDIVQSKRYEELLDALLHRGRGQGVAALRRPELRHRIRGYGKPRRGARLDSSSKAICSATGTPS